MTQEEMQEQIKSMMPTQQQIVKHIDKELEEKRKRIVYNILSEYAKDNGLVEYKYPDGFYVFGNPDRQELAGKKHEEWLIKSKGKITMKAYTDIEQSKKLAEILPIESADMFWLVAGNTPRIHVLTEPLSNYSRWENYPCWSLTALLNAIHIEHNLHGYLTENGMVYRVETLYAGNSKNYDNPVDACVEMIVKLKELKLL